MTWLFPFKLHTLLRFIPHILYRTVTPCYLYISWSIVPYERLSLRVLSFLFRLDCWLRFAPPSGHRCVCQRTLGGGNGQRFSQSLFVRSISEFSENNPSLRGVPSKPSKIQYILKDQKPSIFKASGDFFNLSLKGTKRGIFGAIWNPTLLLFHWFSLKTIVYLRWDIPLCSFYT